MTPSLRFATCDDLTVVQTIIRAAYAHYASRIGREPAPMLADYAALISKNRVHVAELDGHARGVLVLIPQDDAMLLDNVAVVPEAQGSGLGRLMLESAERLAIAAGYGAIELYTNEAMTENIVLYERVGYTRTRWVEEKGLRRIYMIKAIGVRDPR